MVYKGVQHDQIMARSGMQMMNEKRESAQIIQFPLNRRFEARAIEPSLALDARVAAALDPAWYHMEAMDAPKPSNPPKH